MATWIRAFAIRQRRVRLFSVLLVMSLAGCGGGSDSPTGSIDASLESKQAAATTVVAGAASYKVIRLGPADAVCPNMNASGQITFSTNSGDARQAWFYDGTKFQNIGSLGGAQTTAVAVNATGQVAGNSTRAGGTSLTFSQMSLRSMSGVLDTPFCGWQSSPLLNRAGRSPGFSIAAGGTGDGPVQAFSWTAGKGMTVLGTLGGPWAMAAAVNDGGQVVGTSQYGFSSHGFLWSASEGMVDLTPAATQSIALDINNAGQVVGQMSVGVANHAFMWSRAGGLVDLGTIDDSSAFTGGIAINSKGQVVGKSGPNAFWWTQTDGMVNLGPSDYSTYPLLNEPGQVAITSGGNASIWNRTGGWTNLGTLGGHGLTGGNAINNLGQVVGSSYTATQEQHAFVWTQIGGMVDLNNVVVPGTPTLQSAVAVSDNGSILAVTITGNPNSGLYLLVPNTSGSIAPSGIQLPRKQPFQASVPGLFYAASR